MDATYDLAVIGAGPAGTSAAELAAAFGRRTVVIERDRPGGVVATTGGAPTKTLREAAIYLTGYGSGEVYGARQPPPLADVMPVIEKRVTTVRDELQQIAADRLARLGVEYLAGAATLTPRGRLVVTTRDGDRTTVAARTVLVATGSRPARLPGIPYADPDVYDSDRIYAIRTIPDDVVIVGGGATGVEFATVFAALGVPVTVVHQAERLLPGVDGELVELLTADLVEHGVRVVCGVGVAAVERVDGTLTVALTDGTRLPTGAVLLAAGRTPNTDGLGLAEAGVELDGRGRIVVDHYHRSTAPGIYAAGNVVGGGLASVAMQQGRAAACHACGLMVGVAVDRLAAAAVYGMPEVAGVGLTEEQAAASGEPYVVGRCPLATTARGAIAGRGGLLKVIFRVEDRRLLGVHCLGDVAAEVVGLGHLALHLGTSAERLLALGLNTPTYSYAYHDAVLDGLAQLTRQAGPTFVSGEEDARDGALPDPGARPPRPGLVGLADRHPVR